MLKQEVLDKIEKHQPVSRSELENSFGHDLRNWMNILMDNFYQRVERTDTFVYNPHVFDIDPNWTFR